MKTIIVSVFLFIGTTQQAGTGSEPTTSQVLRQETEWYKSQAQVNLDLIEYKASSITNNKTN